MLLRYNVPGRIVSPTEVTGRVDPFADNDEARKSGVMGVGESDSSRSGVVWNEALELATQPVGGGDAKDKGCEKRAKGGTGTVTELGVSATARGPGRRRWWYWGSEREAPRPRLRGRCRGPSRQHGAHRGSGPHWRTQRGRTCCRSLRRCSRWWCCCVGQQQGRWWSCRACWYQVGGWGRGHGYPWRSLSRQ
jgi:hypothetical protein